MGINAAVWFGLARSRENKTEALIDRDSSLMLEFTLNKPGLSDRSA